MENANLKLIADFISKSKTKKLTYTLKKYEIEKGLKTLFLKKSNTELRMVSVSDSYDNLTEIIKVIKPSDNPNNDYTLDEFKFNEDSELEKDNLLDDWHLYVYENKLLNY